jgi:hypothetical protein
MDLHFLYVGHFEKEKGFVKLRDTEPVIEKPLDEKIVQRILAGVGLTLGSLPPYQKKLGVISLTKAVFS